MPDKLNPQAQTLMDRMAAAGDLYTVENKNSVEDSAFNVIAKSFEEAANYYVAAVLAEEISVDAEEMEDDGKLSVRKIDLNGMQHGILAWEKTETREMLLDDIPAWRDRDEDPEP